MSSTKDSKDVMKDSKDVMKDSKAVMKDSKDVMKDSKAVMKNSKDVMKDSKDVPLLSAVCFNTKHSLPPNTKVQLALRLWLGSCRLLSRSSVAITGLGWLGLGKSYNESAPVGTFHCHGYCNKTTEQLD